MKTSERIEKIIYSNPNGMDIFQITKALQEEGRKRKSIMSVTSEMSRLNKQGKFKIIKSEIHKSRNIYFPKEIILAVTPNEVQK